MGFGEGSLMDPENRVSSDPEAIESQINHNGSGFIKKGRSESTEEDWGCLKVQRTSESNTMLNLFGSKENEQTQNMLCFSSPSSELPFLSAKNGGGLAERNSQKQAFSYNDQTHGPFSYTTNAGYVTEGLNEPLLGTRVLFTPSQWIELEHQALVYKYIVANVPIPSNLLIALKKTVNPYGLSSGLYSPTSLGWGTFHLGYPGNADPELGRCRRTDGKKWRCSRDAVADQKYCDRHINRGRHRSRKPVERQTGQAVSGSTAKVSAGAMSASVTPSSSGSNSLSIMHEKSSADALVNWRQELQGHPVVSPCINLKPIDSSFSISKQHNPSEQSQLSMFGLASPNHVLIPPQKSPFINSSNYNSELDFNTHESQVRNPLHLFIDDLPKDQANPVNISWSNDLELDRTQLSMSIPKSSSSGLSSVSSPHTHSPLLRLSSELCPNQMDSAVPILWAGSMGGPLGEALNITSSSGSNHATRAWNGSPQMESSPTEVLQKATFASLSNSSEGSSPRAINTMANEISTCYW